MHSNIILYSYIYLYIQVHTVKLTSFGRAPWMQEFLDVRTDSSGGRDVELGWRADGTGLSISMSWTGSVGLQGADSHW